MESVNNCGVCARPLVYATESVTKTCAICGKEGKQTYTVHLDIMFVIHATAKPR